MPRNPADHGIRPVARLKYCGTSAINLKISKFISFKTRAFRCKVRANDTGALNIRGLDCVAWANAPGCKLIA